MVANLTPRPASAVEWQQIEAVAIEAQGLKDMLLVAVDADTAAFDAVLAARRLRRDTDAARASRDAAVRHAMRAATEVPLGVLRGAGRAAELAREAARRGLPATISDAGVAAICASAAAEGAYYNVLVNLAEMRDAADAEWVRSTHAAANRGLEAATAAAEAVRLEVRRSLAPAGVAAAPEART
jgi:glutamate formiminotransferase/formiminotetrahydrofolate cyclodeaminase